MLSPVILRRCVLSFRLKSSLITIFGWLFPHYLLTLGLMISNVVYPVGDPLSEEKSLAQFLFASDNWPKTFWMKILLFRFRITRETARRQVLLVLLRNLVKKTNQLLSDLGLKSWNTHQTRRMHTKRSGKKTTKTVTFPRWKTWRNCKMLSSIKKLIKPTTCLCLEIV